MTVLVILDLLNFHVNSKIGLFLAVVSFVIIHSCVPFCNIIDLNVGVGDEGSSY